MKKILAITIILVSIFLGFNISQAKHQLKEDFIILTTHPLLKEAMLFANYRSAQFHVSIVTTDEIHSSDPELIRLYLSRHFSSGYLLIIGSEETLPRPLMYPSDTEHGISTSDPSATETDLYYAFLKSDIDKDKDGFAGELYGDRMQIHPDLIVGRIPFDDEETIEEIFENTVNFENRSPKQVVLASSFIAFPGEIYDGAHIFNGDGARSMELIKGLFPVDTVTLYEKGGSYPSLYDCTLPLTKDNFLPSLTNAAFVDWEAHGSSGAAYCETWVDKNENGIPDDGFSFSEFMNKNDSFNASGIFFSGSCLNENGKDNLGKAVLKKGGVAFIGSTEVNFSPSYFASPNDGGSSSINYYFVLNLVQGNTIGNSLYKSFSYFFDNLLYKDIEDPPEGSLMDIYDFNIYGDPALRWKFQQNKINLSKSYEPFNGVDLNVSVSDKKATIGISSQSNNSFFVVLPQGFYIEDVSYKSAIIDRFFGLIRVNDFSGTFEIEGTLRGNVQGEVILKDGLAQNAIAIDVNGYDILDFNFDGSVDISDFKMLLSTFGTTYKNEGFNELCDINFDHCINGKDLFLFMFGK